MCVDEGGDLVGRSSRGEGEERDPEDKEEGGQQQETLQGTGGGPLLSDDHSYSIV